MAKAPLWRPCWRLPLHLCQKLRVWGRQQCNVVEGTTPLLVIPDRPPAAGGVGAAVTLTGPRQHLHECRNSKSSRKWQSPLRRRWQRRLRVETTTRRRNAAQHPALVCFGCVSLNTAASALCLAPPASCLHPCTPSAPLSRLGTCGSPCCRRSSTAAWSRTPVPRVHVRTSPPRHPNAAISVPWCSPACKAGHRCLRPPCFDKTRVSHDLPQTHEQSRIWRALARSRARASRGFAKGSSSQFQEAFRVCVLSERVLILLPYVGCAS